MKIKVDEWKLLLDKNALLIYLFVHGIRVKFLTWLGRESFYQNGKYVIYCFLMKVKHIKSL